VEKATPSVARVDADDLVHAFHLEGAFDEAAQAVEIFQVLEIVDSKGDQAEAVASSWRRTESRWLRINRAPVRTRRRWCSRPS
jgi:hypothetical protein